MPFRGDRFEKDEQTTETVEEKYNENIDLETAALLGKTGKQEEGKLRWEFILMWCTLSVVISYADRTNISTAILEMREEFNWGEAREGTVMSMFFVGYAITQMIGGWMADRAGGKWVLSMGIFLWSLFTFITPYVARTSFGLLLANRIALGLGEGVGFPAIHAIISANMPKAFYSTAAAVATAASYAGTILAYGLSPWIIEKFGWPWVFYLFGLFAVLWLPPWIFTSVEHRSHQNVQVPFRSFYATICKPGAAALFIRAPVVAICLTQYTQSWGLYMLVNWLPTFFKDKYGIEVKDMGFYTLLPYILQLVIGICSGVWADGLISKGWGVKRVRQGFQTVSMIGPAVCFSIVVCPFMPASAALCSVIIAIGSGLSAFSLAGVSVSHLDITPRNAGVVFGAGNTAATLAGFVGVYATGWLLEVTGSWGWVFGVTIIHYLIGTIVWLVWAGDEVLPEDSIL